MGELIDHFLLKDKESAFRCSDEMQALIAESEKGKYPCKHCTVCKYPEFCSKQDCLAWYRWFQYHWANIRKAGGK